MQNFLEQSQRFYCYFSTECLLESSDAKKMAERTKKSRSNEGKKQAKTFSNLNCKHKKIYITPSVTLERNLHLKHIFKKKEYTHCSSSHITFYSSLIFDFFSSFSHIPQIYNIFLLYLLTEIFCPLFLFLLKRCISSLLPFHVTQPLFFFSFLTL